MADVNTTALTTPETTPATATLATPWLVMDIHASVTKSQTNISIILIIMEVISSTRIRYPDINECNTANGGCQQECVNEVASFHCECNAGYLLDENGYNCSGKYNKCVWGKVHARVCVYNVQMSPHCN